MKKAPTKSMLFLAEPAKKDIFAVSRMNSNSCVNHSVAVHIINSGGIVYHHCKRKYGLRLMIYTFGGCTLARDGPLIDLIQQNGKDARYFNLQAG